MRSLDEVFGGHASDPHTVPAANGYGYGVNRFLAAEVVQEVFLFKICLKAALMQESSFLSSLPEIMVPGGESETTGLSVDVLSDFPYFILVTM
ncbi:MAG: hypothetical protein LBT40_09395 [Deltaproteobacteria bacterium]|nr:hypothetical protein [Deltaproteobacteria bacterium]